MLFTSFLPVFVLVLAASPDLIPRVVAPPPGPAAGPAPAAGGPAAGPAPPSTPSTKAKRSWKPMMCECGQCFRSQRWSHQSEMLTTIRVVRFGSNRLYSMYEKG